MSRPDRNALYLAVLLERRLGGGNLVHAGLARHGVGRALCHDELGINRPLFEFSLPAQDPNFALYRPAGWRHRYAEAFLELNRGCLDCLDMLYAASRELGYREHGGLKS